MRSFVFHLCVVCLLAGVFLQTPHTAHAQVRATRLRIPSYTQQNIKGRSCLAIGSVTDSASGLSRSFALQELLLANPLYTSTDTLRPILVDYPFTAPLALTAFIGKKTALLKIYSHGKKLKEVVSAADWPAIYTHLQDALPETERYARYPRLLVPDERLAKQPNRSVNDCLPGQTTSQVPSAAALETIMPHTKLKFHPSMLPYGESKQVYSNYGTLEENSLFFFRSDAVPRNLKDVIRPLVFPAGHQLAPSLNYLACGEKLKLNGDEGAALNNYIAALNVSKTLLASPYERALVRSALFKEMADTHLRCSAERVATGALFTLGAELNQAYLADPVATSQRTQYYEGITKISELSSKAEDVARTIRGQEKRGNTMALLSAVATVAAATTPGYTSAQVDALRDQTLALMNTTADQNSKSIKALNDYYKGIEREVYPDSYISSDGTRIEAGASLLAPEVDYNLRLNPAAAKEPLLRYAADKPKLLQLLKQFYRTSGNSEQADVRTAICNQMALVEIKTLHTELLGGNISSVRAQF